MSKPETERNQTLCEEENAALGFKGGRTVAEKPETIQEGQTTQVEGSFADTAEEKKSALSAGIRDFQKGDILLDTYTVESEAIRGGMGSVWRVHHRNWYVDMAMKRPQPQCFSTETSKVDFRHECEAWIHLGLHPNIVSCYYVRDIEGVPTIFSEWMSGGSLADAIREGTLYEGCELQQQERILDIAIQFARGLHYAHEQGLIHQDVKPDNLLLTELGDAKVADFGLAKARALLTVQEAANTVEKAASMMAASNGYTPAYCSMEQMDGQALTRRTDLYSWAVSVMEMYLGSRPWINGVVAGMNCRQYFKAARVAIPEAVQDLLAQCMETDPEKRPHDFCFIEGVLLAQYLATTDLEYRAVPALSVSGTAAALNNRALSYLDLGKPREAEKLWQQALEKSPHHPASSYNQALYQWRAGQIDDRELIRRCTSSEALYGRVLGAWREKIDAERGVAFEPTRQPHKIPCADRILAHTVSPDGRWLYLGSQSGLLCLETQSDKQQFFVPSSSAIVSVQSSSDGRFLFAMARDRLMVIHPVTGKILNRMEAPAVEMKEFCVQEDGSHAYAIGSDDRLRKWNLATGRCETSSAANSDLFQAKFKKICIDSRNCRLLTLRETGQGEERTQFLTLWDAQNLIKLKERPFEDFKEARDICLSPDGSRIFCTSRKGWEIWTSHDLIPIERHLGGDAQYLWPGADGSLLLIGQEDGTVQLWELDTGRQLYTFASLNESFNRTCSVSADAGLSLIAVRNQSSLIVYPFQRTERVPASWEFCRGKTWREVQQSEREAKLAEESLRDTIRDGKITEAIQKFEKAEKSFDTAPFWPLYRQLAAACHQGNWLASSPYLKMEMPPHRGQSCLAAAKHRIALPSYQSLQIYDEKLAKIASLEAAALIRTLAYSHQGEQLVAVSGEADGPWQLEIWESRTLERRTLIPLPADPAFLRFSPDDRYLAWATPDGEIGLLEVETGSLLHSSTVLAKQSGCSAGIDKILIQDLCFTADGGQIAVAITVFRTEASGDLQEEKRSLCSHKLMIFDTERLALKEACLLEGREDVELQLLMLPVRGLVVLKQHDRMSSRLIFFNTDSWELIQEKKLGEGGSSTNMFVTKEENLIGFSWGQGIALWTFHPDRIFKQIPLPGQEILQTLLSADGCVLMVRTVEELKLFTFRRELFPVKLKDSPYSIFSMDHWDVWEFEDGKRYLRHLDRNRDWYLLAYGLAHTNERAKQIILHKLHLNELPKLPTNPEDSDDSNYPVYMVLQEQVQREKAYWTLRRAAFEAPDDCMRRFAFCRLTGYSWRFDTCDSRGYQSYACGLKPGVNREDIEDLCREMMEKKGCFAKKAEQWLEFLEHVSDEDIQSWVTGETP